MQRQNVFNNILKDKQRRIILQVFGENKEKHIRGNLFGSLKLSRKFLLMYIFGIILPLLITDAFLIRSIYDAEVKNQSFSRENAIDSYAN